jgi:3-isopropylmalate/(R)-2-methylmalate dehydratase small subunit
MLAIELPEHTIAGIFNHNEGSAEISFDLQQDTFTITSDKGTETINYTISAFDKALVQADGWVGFADAKY